MVINVIKEVNGVNSPLKEIEKYNFNPNPILKENIFNTHLEYVKFEYNRNLPGYSFINLDKKLKKEIEAIICLAINHLEKSSSISKGEFVRYSNEPERFMKIINENHINIVDTNKEGLVLFVTENNSFILLINHSSSHLRIIVTSTKNENNFISLLETYERLNLIHKHLDEVLHFAYDFNFGYLNSNIDNLANGLSVEGSFNLKKIRSHNSETYSEILKHFCLSESSNNEGNVYFNLTQKLNTSENEFLEILFQTVYNLNFIEENYNNDIKIENLADKIDTSRLDISKSERLFLTNLQHAYNESYNLHKYTHLYPSNLTLNNVMNDSLNNLNDLIYFKQFSIFYTILLSRFGGNFILGMIGKENLQLINKNIEDSRDSFTFFNNYDLSRINNLNLSIRRNLKNYNFVNKLNLNEKNEIHSLLLENLAFLSSSNIDNYEFDEQNNFYYFFNRQIVIKINFEDHLIFELNLNEKKDALKLIKWFFNIYSDVTKKLNYNKIEYLADNSFGYLTTNLKYLGNGLHYSIEIENKDGHDFSLNTVQENEGFDIEKTEDNLKLYCYLNPNVGIYRLFNVTNELLKALKLSFN